MARDGWVGVAAGAAGVVGAGMAWAGAGWIGVGLAVAGLAFAWMERKKREDVESLARLAETVARDPSHRLAPLFEEIVSLSHRLEAHGEASREVVRRLQEHATLLAWVIDTLDHAVAGAHEGLDEMGAAAKRVRDRAAAVREMSADGMMAVDDLARASEQLHAEAETLNRSVEGSTASMVQIHRTMAGVHRDLDEVSDASDRTFAFIVQVGRAMGSVRERIERSLERFQQMEAHAAQGRGSVDRVRGGIERIRHASERMVRSVQSLAEQSREIEGILEIITDVAEETGLLSLNAAILAAQAGEKGTAFGVVADQIRALARRTRDNATRIARLVEGVQAHIAEANRGIEENLEAVEEGLALGQQASEAIRRIEQVVSASVEEARGIAVSVLEQDEQARTMVDAAGRVNESLHRVAESIHRGMEEMEDVRGRVQGLGTLSEALREAAERQREMGRKMADLMHGVVGQVEDIQKLLDEQDKAAEELTEHLTAVVSSAGSTGESLQQIHAAVRRLVEEADGLRADVRRLLGSESGPREQEEGDGQSGGA